jgi:dihydroorotate dehydrogenase
MKQLARLAFCAVRPVLHVMNAEAAHQLTIASLKVLPPGSAAESDPQLAIDLFGLHFPNPIGLAAGFDKNAEVPAQILGLGFGFAEAGTTTPLPQAGNPRPRLFRLSEDQGVINRLGFNNEGHQAMMRRLSARRRNGIVGVNIGANKDSSDRMADYAAGVKTFGPVADYLTVNVSSPNTPGLRNLQGAEDLKRLLDLLNGERAKLRRTVPMLLKIAPDLDELELHDIAKACIGQVDGVIISNTTISRPALHSAHQTESGGLSGAPLFSLSTQRLAQFYIATEGKIPLIGVGGIRDAETAYAKFAAGASLIQLYSALVYEGPGLVTQISQGLKEKLRTRTIRDIIGCEAEKRAHHIAPGT